MNEYLTKLVKQDLSAAMDNLRRAKLAANSCDPNKLWGCSSRTLQQIIDGYQQWVDKAKAALEEIK